MAMYLANTVDLNFVMLLLLSITQCRGLVKRCYTCRSRGALGDCKDPFLYNVTTVQNLRGVEASPCASGWCAKLVEGMHQDFDAATERICIQRPPIDKEQRCSETFFERRRVYMCFCQGDLCNGTSSVMPTCLIIIISLLILMLSYII